MHRLTDRTVAPLAPSETSNVGTIRSTPRGRDVDGVRRRRLRRGNLIDTSKAAGYVFKVSETCEDLERALRVVYTCYRRFGLMDTSPSGARVTFHHLLPDTRVLVAKKDGDIHSTLTMVVDSAFGLPMEHAASKKQAVSGRTGCIE